jgi:geranylgeranylglycerol-phosphate geranylgeranyltransferase
VIARRAARPTPRLDSGRKTALGVARLMRLSNSLPAATLVLLGGYLAAGLPLARDTWLAAGAMACLTAFGYVTNDLHDLAEDRVNKPDRPLPSGAVTLTTARRLAAGLAVAALALSAPIGAHALLAAGLVLAVLLGYNARLKSTPAVGNVTVAGLAAATLAVGSVAQLGPTAGALGPVWAPAVVLGLFIAAREMLKTLEDVDGDRAAGRRTLAVVYGVDRAARWVTVTAALAVAASLLAYVRMGYSPLYLAVIVAGVDAPLLYTTARLRRDRRPGQVSRCLALLKGSYFAGMVALWLTG